MNSRLLALLACSSLAAFATVPAAHAEVLTAEVGDNADAGTPDVKIDDGALVPTEDGIGGVEEAPGVVDEVPVDEKVDTLDPTDPSIYETRVPEPEERIYTMAGGEIADTAADSAAENAAELAADRVVERVQASAAAQTTSDPQ